jgi:hypothetical protein
MTRRARPSAARVRSSSSPSVGVARISGYGSVKATATVHGGC